jgi:hypothetical protein
MKTIGAMAPIAFPTGRYLPSSPRFAAASSRSLLFGDLRIAKAERSERVDDRGGDHDRVNHLLSAGTTYQGRLRGGVADRVLVGRHVVVPELALLGSLAENFQFFSGLVEASRKRRFCSFFETLQEELADDDAVARGGSARSSGCPGSDPSRCRR